MTRWIRTRSSPLHPGKFTWRETIHFAESRDNLAIIFTGGRLGTLNLNLKARPKEKLAEREGFEPSVSCPTPHFECGALDHYATSPGEIMTQEGL